MITSQRKDGGWSWKGLGGESDWSVSSLTFWALCQARKEGIAIDPNAVSKGKAYLLNAFRGLPATHNDGKAEILHALSMDGAAEFAHVNRLYRERNALTNSALAYTALTFANFKRAELAGEVLNLMLTKSSVHKDDRGSRRYWNYRRSPKRAPFREAERIETTAVSLSS